MIGYVIRRLALQIITIILVTTLVFFTMRLARGDPTTVILGTHASEQAREALRHQLGLDQPLLIQYIDYWEKLVTFDFGRSMVYNYPIASILQQKLSYSFPLMVGGVVLASLLGIITGALAAIYAGSFLDFLIRAISMLGRAVPPYIVGLFLILAFSFALPLFPASEVGGGTITSRLHHLILPACTVALCIFGVLTRITRTSMLEISQENFIATARAKGLSEVRVVWQILRNSLIPIMTVVGMYVGLLLAGTVLTEIVFARPGIGSFLVRSIIIRDYPVVEVSVALIAIFIIFVNLFVDLLYAALDPRIRYA